MRADLDLGSGWSYKTNRHALKKCLHQHIQENKVYYGKTIKKNRNKQKILFMGRKL
jgi:hypothetical protein